MIPVLDHPRFDDAPAFEPAVSPALMLKLGIFGGYYFGARGSQKFCEYTADLPAEWFEGVVMCDDYDRRNNYFGVKCGESYDWWMSKGLIHPADPLGWFHWYCRFYLGRRLEDDARQIARWSNFRRWRTNIINTVPGDVTQRPAVRQSLLHWAYDPFV